jgi:hypothetical protein
MRFIHWFAIVVPCAAVVALACGSDPEPEPAPTTVGDAGPRGVEPAGQACTMASQCYGGVDGGADSGTIQGAVTCITKVTNGYCTHECNDDSNCCAAPGECLTAVKQVCSPFENQPQKYCFLSCEDADIQRAIAANADAGYYDGGAVDGGTVADQYCKSYASPYATCRSSGGGSMNRKVCIPSQ